MMKIQDLIPDDKNFNKGSETRKYLLKILNLKDWHTRRIGLLKISRALGTRIFELERLQQLERLEVQLSTGNYDAVNIPAGAVIYCDPPYKGTAEYAEGQFNHDEFWGWAREKAKEHKIFISEYTAPDDFISVYSFDRKSRLQPGAQQHNNQPREKLFVHESMLKIKKD